MPVPTERGRRYVAGLDGIRALAVLSVIAYHLGFSWAGGGMLGVGVFFTLSGYLITDLLLAHWKRHAELGLRNFWIRRARRLLPALFVMLAVTSVLVALFDAGSLGAMRRQVFSAALYFANWSTIAQHGSYFGRFAAPLPLDHLWSLSIEEQFYLAWPLVILASIWLLRGRARLALAVVLLAAGSAVTMALLYHPGYDPTRVYEGTDTRAFGLLIGAALAVVWRSDPPAFAARRQVRNFLDVLGGLGLVVIAVLIWRTTPFSAFLYPDGFLLLSLATAAVLMATVIPDSRLGQALGAGPLRWLGVRSYGIYLWQWPIIVLISPAGGRVDAGRAVLEVLATLIAAGLSWRFIEQPVRHGALVRLRRRVKAATRSMSPRRAVVTLSGATAGALLLPVLGLAGALPTLSSSAGSRPLIRVLPAALVRSASTVRSVAEVAMKIPLLNLASAESTHTSCRSVVYIGDSTSEGEISSNYIPRSRQRLPSQLAQVGVRTFYPEISGARSTVETYDGHPNAATVAQQYVRRGYRGCWVLAVGTNDVANVHQGGRPGLSERIARMMSVVGHLPVMWVDLITLVAPGSPYAEQGMAAWNRALLGACRRYPNLRIFDWAAEARRKWFIPDGIHYYSPGYVARSNLIAQALAEAFPRRGASAGCSVG